MEKAAAPSKPRMSAEEKRWRAEDDTRALMRAEEIKADAARLKACQEHAKKQATALTKAVGRKR